MSRAVLLAILPWLGLLLGSLACLLLLIRLSAARFEWRRLRSLHGDQAGSAQTLSFVLTLPLFVFVIMLIVQISQLMIGAVVVQYAAFAAARAAAVWIPAEVAGIEPVNCIGVRGLGEAAGEQYVVIDPTDPRYGPTEGGRIYRITPGPGGSPKCERILVAAAMALMPVCPSRDYGFRMPPEGGAAEQIIRSAYQSMVPSAGSNAAIDRRLHNKLAYALQSRNTAIKIECYHSERLPEVPLEVSLWPPMPLPRLLALCPYRDNEIGWQDTITVTVSHRFALLPGPGRLLFRWRNVSRPDGSPDTGAQQIQENEQVSGLYWYPLTASATIGNEGEESVIPYEYHVY